MGGDEAALERGAIGHDGGERTDGVQDFRGIEQIALGAVGHQDFGGGNGHGADAQFLTDVARPMLFT
ncbi:MAG: hypothetical protein ACRD4P_12490 [Bryobacteraceae bacterium]